LILNSNSLKPENVLLDEKGYIKVTDLGLCPEDECKPREENLSVLSDYLAPELITSRRYYTTSVDWWTLGKSNQTLQSILILNQIRRAHL
jgi:serine/threonine protein kinase